MNLPVVTNIQRYCVHDGKGIRTTVFFKGCDLRCRWCHNPEDQRFKPELMFYSERCTGCGDCVSACPRKAVSIYEGVSQTDRSRCVACGKCAEVCVNVAREISGRRIPLDELVRKLERDMPFFESSGGGVTLSGGEVMEQPFEYVLELAKRLSRKGISVNVDTCGHVAWERFEAIAPYVSTFLYDVKAITGELHRELTGVDNSLILSNLMRLGAMGADVNIRIPVVDGGNDTDDEMGKLIDWLRENVPSSAVSLLPYHRAGTEKRARLGESAGENAFAVPSAERMEQLRKRFIENGFSFCSIGG